MGDMDSGEASEAWSAHECTVDYELMLFGPLFTHCLVGGPMWNWVKHRLVR